MKDSMSTDPDSRTGFGPYLEGVGPTYLDGSQLNTIRYGVVEDLERALELHGKNVAAFLVEPIQGEAGCVVSVTTYLYLTDTFVIELLFPKKDISHGSMLCARSTTCSSSVMRSRRDYVERVRCWIASMTTSDRIWSCWARPCRAECIPFLQSLPIGTSCFALSRASMEVLMEGKHVFSPLLFYIDSFVCRNPLGCAVAMTALKVLVDERLAERATVLGELFRSSVTKLNSPLVQTVRGRGLLNAVIIDESKSRKGRTAWQLCLLLKSRGVLAKPTHVNM